MEQLEEVKKAPKILKLINDFDTWNRTNSKFSWENEILPLSYYISSLGIDLNNNESRIG